MFDLKYRSVIRNVKRKLGGSLMLDIFSLHFVAPLVSVGVEGVS
jgi:hypothetical protein